MNNETTDSKSIFKEWLEKLQQESWQLELLISGFALFGIYSARILIVNYGFYIENNISSESIKPLAKMLYIVFQVGWYIFFLNLLVHVVLRGLWIGAIGLRYVSQEIDYDNFNYSTIFNEYLRKKVGSYDDYIEKLEKICSVIFAFTFLLFALFLSLILFFIPVLLIRLILENFLEGMLLVSTTGLLSIIYVGLGFFVFLDLITLGGFKKIKDKNISKIYFYIYRFYSFVTLSFLYRPLLYNFIDNSYTKKLFYLSIPYIFIVSVGSNMFENTFNPYLPDRDVIIDSGLLLDNFYYDDLRDDYLSEHANELRFLNKQNMHMVSLENFHIREDFSSIFIRIDKNLMNIIEKDSTIKPYKEKGISFSLFNNNKIDDLEIEKLEQNKSKEIAILYKKRIEIKKEFKEDKNKLQTALNAIEQEIVETEDNWTERIKNIKINKAKNIKKAFISNYEMFLDNTKIPLDDSFYYNHQNLEEQGFKCFFATDSIKKGIHKIKIRYNYLIQNADNTYKLTKDSIYLPILKH